MPRDYKREYEKYHSSEKQKKRRAARNKARRQAERDGKVRKGDGKDVHHKDHNPRNNGKKNLSVKDASSNRADNLGKGGRPRKKMRGRR
jgi:hypothetical protein